MLTDENLFIHFLPNRVDGLAHVVVVRIGVRDKLNENIAKKYHLISFHSCISSLNSFFPYPKECFSREVKPEG